MKRILCRVFGHRMHEGAVSLSSDGERASLECPRCGKRWLPLAKIDPWAVWDDAFFREYMNIPPFITVTRND